MLTIVAAIDDATGTVPYALFREQEDAHGYFLLLQGIIQRKGIPLALYSDRHGIFLVNRKQTESLDEQLAGERHPTQFGRALQQLGIQSILAHSPQAKGRIERMWGTFQDRLVAELRLAGVTTMQEANQVLWGYLPRFNTRFGVPAANSGSAYRPTPTKLDLASVLCFQYQRTVAKDNTVRLGEHTLQLLPGPERTSYARARVQIQERLDGSLV
ncbi:MAG: integrase, partial [Chloroflexota bacterium]